MIKFPSINQFRHVVNHVRQQARFMGLDDEGNAIMNPAPVYPTMSFMGTVKLHGTNAAIVKSPDWSLHFQSRERIIVIGDDNAGFAAHFDGYTAKLRRMVADLEYENTGLDNATVALFGEWCGSNIQKGVGIASLPKMFVVFAVKVNDQWRPDLVHQLKSPEMNIYNIEMFPKWFYSIDFEHPEKAQNHLAALTQQVEDQCPVAKHFGAEGIGEGIVWQSIDNPSSDLWFKVKGEKHSASKVKTLASVDVEAIESINAFVTGAVTEARLEQGLQNLLNEQKMPFDMTSIGAFIKWVHNDVVKEESDTMQANGFDHKKLGGPIAQASKRWYVQKLNEQVMA